MTFRSIEGTETSGSAHALYLRISFADYPDGKGEEMWDVPARYNARQISNECLAGDEENGMTASGISDMLWQFGQFLDHDIDLTEIGESAGTADIDCPVAGDSMCDAGPISFTRSLFQLDGNGVRQHENFITALIDGSAVYGSTISRALGLRTMVDGKLKTSEGNLLPFNEDGFENAGGTETMEATM